MLEQNLSFHLGKVQVSHAILFFQFLITKLRF
jgi:hypothetical protein